MSEVSGKGFVDQEEPEHRRPREHLNGGGAVRSDRRAVGGAGTVTAHTVAAGSSVLVEQTATDRRDPVGAPGGCAVAGRSRCVRILVGGLWVVPSLAAGRCLAGGPARAASG